MISNQSRDPNVNAVCAKLVQRSEVGLRKYGVTTARPDLSLADWLNHLQQELMDAAVYCEAALGGVKEDGGWRMEDGNRSARTEVSAMSEEERIQLEAVGRRMMQIPVSTGNPSFNRVLDEIIARSLGHAVGLFDVAKIKQACIAYADHCQTITEVVLPLPNHAGYWWYRTIGLSDWSLVLAEKNEFATNIGYLRLSECSGAWSGRTLESFRDEPPSQWIPARPPA